MNESVLVRSALRRRTLATLAGGMLAAPAVRAQGFGSGRPLRLIIPYGPGSINDTLARLIAPALQARLGNPVVVENRTGASGTIAMTHVARATPDGLTLALAAASDLTSIRFLQANLPYDPATAFVPIIMVSVAHNALATPASVPARNLPELIEWLRANPNRPYASAAIGSNAHLGIEELQRRAGFRAEHVLYRTGALQALLTGEVTMFLQHELALRQHAEAGTIRLYGIASPERLAHRPNLPTIAEQGFPGFRFQSWFGIVAPAGIAPEIVARINTELDGIIGSSEGRETLLARGVDAAGGPPRVLAERIASDTELFGNVIRTANIRPEG